MSTEEALKKLESNDEGLSEKEAELRIKIHGYNEFGKGRKRTLLDLLISQFKNGIFFLLIVAAVISYFIGHYTDAIAIGIVVLLNILFGAVLEFKADESMEKLKTLAETKAIVMRNGKKNQISSRFLVPGDIIFLEAGAKVPADARILHEHDLETNESSLTGESAFVKKSTKKLELKTPLAKRSNIIYAGTFVARGSAKALVISTGRKTEFGAIEESLGKVEGEQTPLEKTLTELGKSIVICSFIIVSVLFFVGMILGKWTTEELIIYSISVIIAAVPEGLITILTIILAVGVQNMARERVLVRKLRAVETLGNITVIATDKTGTITEGKMTLAKVYDGATIKNFADLNGKEEILFYSYLCNSAHFTEGGVVGDETDCAFLTAGITKGINVKKFRQNTKQIAFFSFDPVKKTMSGIYEIEDANERKMVAIVKGAPENVLEMCSTFGPMHEKITGNKKKEINAVLTSLTSEGMRLIAVACGKPRYKKIPENGLRFCGFLALYDQIRPEVKETIRICNDAGIRVIMITGDNIATANKIANEIGFSDSLVVNWAELEHMNDEELDKMLRHTGVIARATPAAKLRLVERLVKQNEIVAMTGDGVNDALAIKKAHVGIVMGRVGTDVSKEVADLVLMDDNFTTLEKAVEYGRGITRNIFNFIKFQITTNVALVIMAIPYVIGIKLLEPVHILWINLLIDGPPAMTLGLEKPKKEIMKEKPKKKNTFITMDFVFDTLNMAVWMVAVVLLVFFYYSKTEPSKAISMVFTTFAFMQIFNALNSRSSEEHFYTSLSSNKWLVIALVAVAFAQIAIISIESISQIFGIVQLSLSDLAIVILCASSVLVVGESKKIIDRIRKS